MGFLTPLAICLAVVCFSIVTEGNNRSVPPHIIVIVADDLGWNDVGFHGSNEIPTPNLDALAYSGVILNNYYVDPICTPSRSALMTGYHPIHTGMQSGVLVGAAPYALPLRFRLMPEYLNDLSYDSRMVGKWHLGSHRAAYAPTRRGFKSHLGYWTGHMDYYDHSAQELYGPVQGWGYDFRRDLNVSWSDFGKYSTDIFTDEAVHVIKTHAKETQNTRPLFLYLAHQAVHSANTYSPLQAPHEIVDKFEKTIPDENRRKFAGMLTKLDDSVGEVVRALAEEGMLANSVIVFTTDNGGPAAGFDVNYASNWPLKGVKNTLWEGGVRGVGFMWSPLIEQPWRSRVSQQMMNIQDWLPTLHTAAGGRVSQLPPMDGLDMWEALTHGEKSPRNLMLHNIDDSRLIAAVRVGDWKFVRGTTYKGRWDGWYGPSGRGEGLSYDVDAVLSSPAAEAISAAGVEMPRKEKLLEIRSESMIKCVKTGLPRKKCNPMQQVCLFNVTADPCEMNNLAFDFPTVIRVMESTLNTYNLTAIPPGNKPIDPRADPKFWDYTWTNWMDFVDPEGFEEEDREELMVGRENYVSDAQIADHLITAFGKNLFGIK